MLRSVGARVAWVGRTAAMLFGLALVLALVVGGATAALAAVPGDPLKLGQANTIDALTRLTGAVNNPMLRIDNNSTNASATALELRVEPGHAPMKVDSDARVVSLNADEVDGHSVNEIGVNGWERVEATSVTNARSPKSATARCPSGKMVVGTGAEITGGKYNPGPPSNTHINTDVVIDEIIPSLSRLSVIVKAYEVNGTDEDWNVTAYAICATVP
jgi:hypothetical protein